MIVNSKNETFRTPRVLTVSEMRLAKSYIKRTVKNFIKKNPVFNVRDLFGYANWNWNGTPLQAIYDNYCDAGYSSEDAYTQSGIAIGWILKNSIHEMPECFRVEHSDHNPVVYHYLKTKPFVAKNK